MSSNEEIHKEAADSASSAAPASPASPRRRTPMLLRVLKWLAVTVLVVVLLLVMAVGVAVWYLSPEKLTPLASEMAGRYLDAEVKADRIELFFWSTFPKVTVEIDDLAVKSLSLRELPQSVRDSLPSDADSLLFLKSFRGSIDLSALSKGTVSLRDVELDRPRVNLVDAGNGMANYNIVPPSDTAEIRENGPLPDISVNRFEIKGDAPVRYFSLADSIDMTVSFRAVGLEGDDAPLYAVDVAGNGSGHLARIRHMVDVPFGINGNVRFDLKKPDAVGLEAFTVSLGGLNASVDASVAFGDSLRIESFRLYDTRLKLSDLIELASCVDGLDLTAVHTDLTADLSARLLSPYTVGSQRLPDVEARLLLPQGTLTYDRLRLDRFSADLTARLPGGDLGRAELIIDDLVAVGPGVGFSLKGKALAAGNLSDPILSGTFKGGLGFARLPRRLLAGLPFTAQGRLTGVTDFRFRPSYLSKDGFHRIAADGNLRLENFNMVMRDSSATAYTRVAQLKFGSRSDLRRSDRMVVDSLLKVTLDFDTVNLFSGGVRFIGNGLHAGVGVKNVAGSFDTTMITPIGARISAERFIMRSDSDSLRLRLRDMAVTAALLRFNGESRKPLLRLDIESGRLRYSDRLNRASLTDAHISLKLHPRQRPRLSARALAIYDSIGYVCPNLSPDSVYSLTMAEMRSSARRRRRLSASDDSTRFAAMRAVRDEESNIDFGVDNSVRSWLRLWEAEGSVTAARARAFTPYFPVRNTIRNLSVDFNTDSLVIRDTRYRSGLTSLKVNGSVKNITSAVTSRRGAPIELALDIDCDTLDINAFANAAFAGSAFSAREDSVHVSIPDSESDEEIQKSIEKVAGADRLAFRVPLNVKADLNVRAREVLYADIWLQRLTGRLEIADGAVRLNRLGGYTDMGTIDITALYSAPNYHDIDFAAGMVIRRLDLRKFLHMMPQVDSILPLLRHVEGFITADLAMTTELDSLMDFRFHTLKAAMRLEGDSLVVLDNKTFATLAKWLLFKRKDRNMIDHMNVEMMIADSRLDVLPFEFDFDRYKLGVWGGNTLDMHYDYHVAVLKSPLPFKFGVTVKGHGDDFRIRLGKANFNPDKIVSSRQLTDTVRINLINEIRNVFRFGVNSDNRNRKLVLSTQGSQRLSSPEYSVGDTLTHADSVLFMQEGVIPMTEAVADSLASVMDRQSGKKPDKRKKKNSKNRK